jgi:hypothetical protein
MVLRAKANPEYRVGLWRPTGAWRPRVTRGTWSRSSVHRHIVALALAALQIANRLAEEIRKNGA